MKKSIPLKEIVGFLPYGLKLECRNFGSEKKTFIVDFLGTNQCDIIISNPYGGIDYSEFEDIYPIVRPLSDLTKEITHNGETFVPIKWLKKNYTDHKLKLDGKCIILSDSYSLEQDILGAPLAIIEKLHEWHFDIYDWIKDGLAIDLNTL